MAKNIVTLNVNSVDYTTRPYGTCSTAASTAAKVVTCADFDLVSGTTIMVKFSYANSASTPTLNVNGKGAKNIFNNGLLITSGNNKALLAGVVEFMYDGTQWNLIGNYVDTINIYALPTASSNTLGGVKIGTGISISSSGVISISTATTSVNGLMSSTDKTKLNGIAANANNYSLPAAGSILGGVKSGGDVTISNGVITVNDNSHSHTIKDITYANLRTLVNNGTLVPGEKYKITDYSCIYIQPVTKIETEVPAPDITGIVCTALTNNTLSENVEILRASGYAKIIECKYDINPENCAWTKGMTTKSPKGVIWYMKDEYGNVSSCDFKHIKYRRYAITNILANMTLNNGASNPSPYRVNVRDNSIGVTNSTVIGAGENDENTLIPAIINGTWAGCIEDLKRTSCYSSDDLAAGFHSDYSNYYHKFYSNSSSVNDKYLAPFTSDTSWVNKPVSSVGGQTKITIDPNDYMDRYMFDYNGTDASERKKYNGTEPLVKDCLVSAFATGKSIKSLPDTVFAISALVINNASTELRHIEIPQGLYNTFLIRPELNSSSAIINRFSVKGQLASNLIIVNTNLIHTYCEGNMNQNFFNANLNYGHFEGPLYNVFIGAFNNINCTGLTSRLLWYGSFSRIRLNNGDWKATNGNIYSYLSHLGYVTSSILGPMQYSKLDNVLGCTFRACYTKGVDLSKGYTYGKSFGNIAFSTFEYGIGGLGIKFGKIIRSHINSEAFGEFYWNINNKAIEIFNNNNSKIIDLCYADITANLINPLLLNQMTSNEINLLTLEGGSTRLTRRAVYYNGTKFFVVENLGLS